MWSCVLFQLMNQLWACRKRLYMLDPKVKVNVQQYKGHKLSNPYIHLVHEQSHFFIAMEKCMKSFILEKNSKIASQERKNQYHVLPPRGRLGPVTFWNLVMTHLAYLNILHTTQSWHQLSHLLLSLITPSQRRYIRKINREINTFYPSYQICSGCLSC